MYPTATCVRRNVCGCETYPLLKTINRVLGRLPGPGPDCYLDEERRDDLDGVVIDNNEIGYAEEDDRAQCTEPLLKGHPTDCGKYVICEFGMLREQPCPSSLHFNKVSPRRLGKFIVFPGDGTVYTKGLHGPTAGPDRDSVLLFHNGLVPRTVVYRKFDRSNFGTSLAVAMPDIFFVVGRGILFTQLARYIVYYTKR